LDVLCQLRCLVRWIQYVQDPRDAVRDRHGSWMMALLEGGEGNQRLHFELGLQQAELLNVQRIVTLGLG
jgi:hypothetical protein